MWRTGYFAAWNARDPEAVAAAFAEDGIYRDPGVPDGLGPAATAGYAAGLWAAFPDLAFAVDDVTGDGEGRVWARWLMTGTNTGPFARPAAHRAADQRAGRRPGADAAATGVAEVQGFFDTAAVPRQLGMQVVVQPDQVGPFRFGTSVVGLPGTDGAGRGESHGAGGVEPRGPGGGPRAHARHRRRA